jgi:hypothetical protein
MEKESGENQTLQSKIKSTLSDLAGTGSKPAEEANEALSQNNSRFSLFTSFFNGLGVGLLLGLLLGLAVSPVVSAIIGTLSSLLAILLGLNENYLSPVKSIRIGAFGVFCVIGILSGMYIRSHNSMAPPLHKLYDEYKAMGFSEKEAREFIAYQEFDLVPGTWSKAVTAVSTDSIASTDQPAPVNNETKFVASGENMNAKKRKSVLYSSEVDAGKCYTLESSNEKMAYADVKMNFIVAGGTWKELADDLDPGLPENVRKKTLLMLRDIFCASGGSGTIKVKCSNLQDINENTSTENIRKILLPSGEVWGKIVMSIDNNIDSAYQKKLYLSLIKILCHG